MGLMAKIKTAATALVALGGISKVLSVASWLPGVGPVAGIASAVLGFLGAVVKKTFEGATVMLANPATFVVAGIVGLSAFTFGVIHGGQRGAERVAELKQERKDAHDAAEKRLADALAARDAAEKAAQEAAEKSAHDAAMAQRRASSATARARRMRTDDTSAAASGDGLCLPGFPAVFGGCKPSSSQ